MFLSAGSSPGGARVFKLLVTEVRHNFVSSVGNAKLTCFVSLEL